MSLHKTSKTKSIKLNIVSVRAAIQTLGTPTTEGHARDQSQGGVLNLEGVYPDNRCGKMGLGRTH